jgi:hypothetical protein
LPPFFPAFFYDTVSVQDNSNITNYTGILSVVEHVHACAEISCVIARHFC